MLQHTSAARCTPNANRGNGTLNNACVKARCVVLCCVLRCVLRRVAGRRTITTTQNATHNFLLREEGRPCANLDTTASFTFPPTAGNRTGDLGASADNTNRKRNTPTQRRAQTHVTQNHNRTAMTSSTKHGYDQHNSDDVINTTAMTSSTKQR